MPTQRRETTSTLIENFLINNYPDLWTASKELLVGIGID